MEKEMAKRMGDKAIEALKKEFPNYEVKLLSGRFGANDLKVQIGITVPNAEGVVVPAEVTNFTKYATFFGLSPDMLGKKFTSRGIEYTIAGLNPRRRKYKISTVASNGARSSWDSRDVLLLMGKPVALQEVVK